MKPEEIHLSDFMRILVGQVPGQFYIELVIRAIVIYLILLVSMRIMGKRMSSQLGRTDMAAMVSLAAAIGVPMQAPDRGLLPAVIIAIVVIYVGRFIAEKSFKSQSFETFVQGNLGTIVKDSVLCMDVMKDTRLTRERLVGQLRSEGIRHLGEVKRLYMEANGSFSLVKEEEPRPGLPVLPRWDKEFNAKFKKVDDVIVCQTCGTTQKKPFDPNEKCPNCGDKVWTDAVLN